MWKSLTDSIRFLWPSSTEELNKTPTGSKRKSSISDGSDGNGKRRKLENHSSTFTGLVRHSVTRMADWMRPKPKPFSEDFATRPSHRTEISGRPFVSQENGSHRGQNHIARFNTEGHQNHVTDSRGGLFKHKTESSVNDVDIQPRRVLENSNFSRRPSESSIYGHKKRSVANESVRLKEKEQYQQLLQLQCQRSPWQAKIPLSIPAGESSSAISCSAPKNFRPQDDGFLKSKIEVAELLKASAMSSLLSRQRHKAEISVPLSVRNVNIGQFSLKKSTEPQPIPAQHSRAASRAFPSRTFGQRGSISSRQDLVRKENHRHNDLIVIEDDMKSNGGWHETKNKINGDIDRPEMDITQRVPEVIVIEDEDEDRGIKRRVPHLNASHREVEQHFPLDASKIQACYKRRQAYNQEKEKRLSEIEEEEMKAKAYEEKRRLQTLQLEKQMKYQMRIFDETPAVTEEICVEDEEEEEDKLPELDDEMMAVVNAALRPGNSNEILSDAFRLQITRKDIATLGGLNWLNDEVVNFYMNMLMERGEREGQAKVYAFNTFFYPKIMSGGHAAVKRWTKKVDIFSVHFILIPVHLGMHWCLCVVDMQKKTITYYDSMGASNNQCLQAVLNYINDESIAKKQTPIKKSEWTLVNAEDNPEQMNGSDCGMFMCKYAEYITRQKDFTFTQEDMPYFRKRMVYEIISKKLLQ